MSRLEWSRMTEENGRVHLAARMGAVLVEIMWTPLTGSDEGVAQADIIYDPDGTGQMACNLVAFGNILPERGTIEEIKGLVACACQELASDLGAFVPDSWTCGGGES